MLLLLLGEGVLLKCQGIWRDHRKMALVCVE